jgi:hypothetical protein
MKQVSQWRTVGVVLIAIVVLFLAFRLAVHEPGAKDAFAILRDGVVLLAATVATKSLGQYLGAGGGVKGAAAALLTEAKPGDARPGAQP